jgi:N-acetylglutamate synthase-like GNAT family acetyltransferase
MLAQAARPARFPGISPNCRDTGHRDNQITIRRAVEVDQAAITALVRLERLNPTDLDWRRFWVAVYGPEVVGAAQLRRHPDSSCEVSSLVVGRSYRHQGVASRLLDALLTDAAPECYLVTGTALAEYYGQWGFQRTSVARAPRCIRRNYWLGQVGGFVISCIKKRKPRRPVVLHRVSATAVAVQA